MVVLHLRFVFILWCLLEFGVCDMLVCVLCLYFLLNSIAVNFFIFCVLLLGFGWF